MRGREGGKYVYIIVRGREGKKEIEREGGERERGKEGGREGIKEKGRRERGETKRGKGERYP